MVKITKKKGSSILKEIEKPRSVNDAERTANFKLSFQDLDTTQKFGSAFLAHPLNASMTIFESI